ncbi:MAG TPA: PilZ domain-containing protein, partial [Terriglobales bacterium]
NGAPSSLPIQSGERRKNPRFDMHFPVFLRALGDSWAVSETADVSATGAFFVTDRPFLLNTPIEYVLTFPPDLTKAPQPLRVRFLGVVLRCERVPDSNKAFGIAVRNTAHRYLSREESASFDDGAQNRSTTSDTTVATQPRKTGI